MKIAVQKNHLRDQIWYRSFIPIKKRRHCDNLDQSNSSVISDCVTERIANNKFYTQIKERLTLTPFLWEDYFLTLIF